MRDTQISHGRRRTRFLVLSGLLLLVATACESRQDGRNELGAASTQALVTSANSPDEPDGRDRSGVTVRWVASESVHGVRSVDADAPLELELSNTESRAHDVDVTLQLWGLRAHRVQFVGRVRVEPKSSARVSWIPSTSPIQPENRMLRVLAQARYESDTRKLAIPASPAFAAYNKNLSKLYITQRNGSAAVAAAAGGPGSAGSSPPLGSRKGKLDGMTIDDGVAGATGAVLPGAQAPSFTSYGWSALDTETGDIGETASSPVENNSISSAAISDSDQTTLAATSINPCLYRSGGITWSEPYTVASVCTKWKPVGYRDVRVFSSSVPEESFNAFSSPAAYATATVYRNGGAIWSGKTAANGCTPALSFCRPSSSTGLTISVSTASLQAPAVWNSTYPYPGSRELRITPARTFSAVVVLSSSSTTGATLANANVYASTEEDDRILRVASIGSRILTMADNGVRDADQAPVPLTLQTEEGCCDIPSLRYTDSNGIERCGEACGGENRVSFGESLSFANPTPSGEGTPTGIHTTADANTIAHEVGHSIAKNSGVTGLSNYNPPAYGICSCDHVTDGNQLHCLQSLHDHQTAFTEGWAHFFATRVLNDKGVAARFTYYKNIKKRVSYNSGGTIVYGSESVAPPIPILASSPYLAPENNVTGWVRAYCPVVDSSSEYDWMTFLWALNGKTGSGMIEMPSLFGLFDNPAVRDANFTWSNLVSESETDFGFGSVRAARFSSQGALNGVSL